MKMNLILKMSQPSWTKMVKMSLINQHHIMSDDTISNDVWYSVQVGFYVLKIAPKEIVYTRIPRTGSLQYSS